MNINNIVEKMEDISFQVQSGNREEIPDAHGDKDLELLSTLIEFGWHQNPDERPTFKQITQKLSTISSFQINSQAFEHFIQLLLTS